MKRLFEKVLHRRAGLARRKTGVSRIERRNPAHLLIRERKVENVQVFLHPLGIGGFHDGDDAALREPAKRNLSDRLAAAFGDGGERVVVQQRRLSGRQGIC